MSHHARLVLALIDQAERTRERHPTLFAAQLRRDRDCRQLAAALARYKREKPTAHSRPFRDQVEAVDDPEWMSGETERVQHRYERNRLKFDARRREQLAAMDPLTLHRLAVAEAAEMSTVAAGNVEPSRGGSETGGVPRQQLLDDDPRWKVAQAIIKRQLLNLHELIAEAKGLSHGKAIAAMTGPEKDEVILREGAGMIAEDVVAMLGRDYGSASYIRRLRRERGLDTRGYRREER